MRLAALGNALADALLPACCPSCLRSPGPSCCPSCREELQRITHPCPHCAAPRAACDAACRICASRGLPHIRSCHVAWSYRGSLRRLVHRAKGAAQQAAVKELRGLWPEDFDVPQVEALCVIPASKHRQRGTHLAQSLAEQLARTLDCPLLPLLQWQQSTCAQHQLGERDRRRNMRDSLHCRQDPPASVLIVDDILTTGATCSEAARALRSAGCTAVHACCLARSPRLGDPQPNN